MIEITVCLLTAVECTDRPPVFTNSTLQHSNPTSATYFYGDDVTYMCSDFYYYDYDANYDVIWEYNSTCDETGNWSVQSELCQREASKKSFDCFLFQLVVYPVTLDLRVCMFA